MSISATDSISPIACSRSARSSSSSISSFLTGRNLIWDVFPISFSLPNSDSSSSSKSKSIAPVSVKSNSDSSSSSKSKSIAPVSVKSNSGSPSSSKSKSIAPVSVKSNSGSSSSSKSKSIAPVSVKSDSDSSSSSKLKSIGAVSSWKSSAVNSSNSGWRSFLNATSNGIVSPSFFLADCLSSSVSAVVSSTSGPFTPSGTLSSGSSTPSASKTSVGRSVSSVCPASSASIGICSSCST